MIASLAAVGLGTGLGTTSQYTGAPIIDDSPIPEEAELTIPTFDAPERTVDTSRRHEAVVSTSQGDIVITLSPDAPEAVNSLAFLAGQNFYDGLEFYWVLPGFNVQTGDPTCAASGELTCTGTGGPGYTLPREEADAAGKWSVFVPAVTPGAPQVHGSQIVIALTDEPNFDGTLLGEVIEGQEILESLPERTPCFGAEPSDANPCQTPDQMPAPLVIEDVLVRPAGS